MWEKDVSDICVLVLGDGFADFAEWEKDTPLLLLTGCVLIVERDLDKKTKFWLFLMKTGKIFGCHQLYNRSFKIKGWQFPLCARCTGIFFGQIIALILFLLKLYLPWYFCIIFTIPLAVDGTLQYFKKLESNNIRRLITGLLCGFGYFTIVLYILKLIFSVIF